MTKMTHLVRPALTPILSLCLIAIATVNAQPIPLSHVGVNQNLNPNIVIMVDDSTSIDWEIMTSGQWTLGAYISGLPKYMMTGDGIYNSPNKSEDCDRLNYAYIWDFADNVWNDRCNGLALKNAPALIAADWRIFSSDFNKLYYNPSITYLPWPGFEDASFSKARSHPEKSQKGYNLTENLGTTNLQFMAWQDSAGFSGETPSPTTATTQTNGVVDLWDDFTSYELTSNTILVKNYTFQPKKNKACADSDGLDVNAYVKCFNGKVKIEPWSDPFGRSISEEQQNIANWFQYHRKRSFALRNVVAQIVNQFPDFHYGLDFTTNYNNAFIEVPDATNELTSHNENLISTMFSYVQRNAGTPLATALDRVGQYFQGTISGKSSPITQSCQANYALMLTDGFWNDQRSYTGQAKGDLDGDGASGDGTNTTLADISTFYFEQDLSPQLENNVALERTKCASVASPEHQHMSTIGVTFGPFGNLKQDSEGCWPAPAIESDDDWGNPLGHSQEDLLARIDDLWHAAYNSNGFFTSSADPRILLEELGDIFTSIGQINTSGSRGTLASSKITGENALFVSNYAISTNTGSLSKFPVNNEETGISTTPDWTTDSLQGDSQISGKNRTILGLNTTSNRGVTLSGANGATALSPQQRQALFPQATTAQQLTLTQAWLDELAQAPMGATVHSNPTFVGQPSRSKGLQLESVREGYAEFQAKQKTALKRSMIYIGSNRGLLHGIDMDTGNEIFTYLPDALFNEYTSREAPYSSKFDGPITAEDVYLQGQDRWATVIVAGFRYGGSGYVALDVTDPDGIASGKGTSGILWEYSNQGTNSRNNPNLGYSYSRAAMGRMANGKWIAAFGNGYNSESGEASLLIVDIETGNLIREFKSGIGPGSDPLQLDRANAMAEPALVDQNQDGIVDVIYAGDFFGNLYRFDVSSESANAWDSTLLFNTDGAAITSRPAVVRGVQQELMVIVGTGQDVTPNPSNASANALYGIRDNEQTVSKSDLRQLNLKSNGQGVSIDIATTTQSQEEVLGWMLSLTGPANGFKMTTQPLIELGELTVLFTRASQNVCGPNDSASILLKMNPQLGTSLKRDVFLVGIDNDSSDAFVDGVILNNTLLNDISLAGYDNAGLIVGNSADGKLIQIETAPPPNAEGRQRFRRIYD